MLSDPLRTALETAIGRAAGAPFAIRRATAVTGGCIHSSWVLESGTTRYFAKTNDAGRAGTFAAEADGLAALADAGIRVPRPIAQGEADGSAFLVLEHLTLGHGSDAAFRELGRALARLHAHRGDGFGWHRDNFIGLTRTVELRGTPPGRSSGSASGSRRSSIWQCGTVIAGSCSCSEVG